MISTLYNYKLYIYIYYLYAYTFFPFLANNVAKLLEVVVFPTPPFPPTKIHFSYKCSTKFFSVGSNCCILNIDIYRYIKKYFNISRKKINFKL